MEIGIRELTKPEEFKECMRIQLAAWGMPPEEIVPHHIMRSVAKFGGLAIGAFDGEKLVGFAFGLPGSYNERPVHYSHMVAVLPEYRNRGIGFQLKLRQREMAMEQGFDLMIWTFDPLQALNAWFNLRKLGVICRRYYVNYYGPMEDELNRGMETDRFLAEWWLTSPRVERRIKGMSGGDAEGCLAMEVEEQEEFRVPVGFKYNLDCDRVLVEIPANIVSIKRKNLDVAKKWQMALRDVLLAYLNRGYIVSNVVRREGLYYYLLAKASLEELLL